MLTPWWWEAVYNEPVQKRLCACSGWFPTWAQWSCSAWRGSWPEVHLPSQLVVSLLSCSFVCLQDVFVWQMSVWIQPKYPNSAAARHYAERLLSPISQNSSVWTFLPLSMSSSLPSSRLFLQVLSKWRKYQVHTRWLAAHRARFQTQRSRETH